MSDSEFLDGAVWIGVFEEGSHLRFTDLDILLVFSNVKSELESLGVLDSDDFTSANDELDWDEDWLLEISAVSFIADYNTSLEVSSFSCVNNDVLFIIEDQSLWWSI